ncbi:DUF5131 family protein [Streptomyces acidicola]|uniref:DUF5131 family protein n=1 Tax=Streptomyces acidicola TaxID=2596892 RepID=UPI003439C664
MPYGWKSPRTVFMNSMSDPFHARVPLDYVRHVFEVIAETPQHTYQVLTTRARRLRQIAGAGKHAAALRFAENISFSTAHAVDAMGWPSVDWPVAHAAAIAWQAVTERASHGVPLSPSCTPEPASPR